MMFKYLWKSRFRFVFNPKILKSRKLGFAVETSLLINLFIYVIFRISISSPTHNVNLF